MNKDYYITNLIESKSNKETDNKNIEVEAIPLCMDCLFEIKEGIFVCNHCMKNLCQVHKDRHLEMNREQCKEKIFRLVLKN